VGATHRNSTFLRINVSGPTPPHVPVTCGRHGRERLHRARQLLALDAKALDDVLKLSAMQDLDDLVSRADKLWPARLQSIERFQEWIRDAQRVVDRLPAAQFEGTG